MRPKIVIIGTGHRLQAGHSEYSVDQHKRFRELLERTCKKYRIKLIVEEMSEDMLPTFGTRETNGKQVATGKGIQHEYIELSGKELWDLGIARYLLQQIEQSAKLSPPQFAALERTTWELRECVWLTRVLKLNIWPTLFICGADHGSRVKHGGFKFQVQRVKDGAVAHRLPGASQN